MASGLQQAYRPLETLLSRPAPGLGTRVVGACLAGDSLAGDSLA